MISLICGILKLQQTSDGNSNKKADSDTENRGGSQGWEERGTRGVGSGRYTLLYVRQDARMHCTTWGTQRIFCHNCKQYNL